MTKAEIRIDMGEELTAGYTRLGKPWGENDIVKTISVECPLDESELPLRIEVTTTPKITKAVIEELKPWHRRIVIEGRTITAQMIRSRLAKRKNREKNASLMVTVREQDSGKVVARESRSFEIEPWNGVPQHHVQLGAEARNEHKHRWFEEQLRWARFVTPCEHCVDDVAREVGHKAKRAKRKVRKEPKWIARAVLEALKRRDWKYAIHPDVAYPPVMLAQRKVGSCADSSIMFAAVMMALGLRPLLILIENHMMAGVWIRGRPYSRSTFDNAAQFQNAVSEGSIVVAETTGIFSHRKRIDGKDMLREGNRQLKRNTMRFQLAIDVEDAHLQEPPMEVPAQY